MSTLSKSDHTKIIEDNVDLTVDALNFIDRKGSSSFEDVQAFLTSRTKPGHTVAEQVNAMLDTGLITDSREIGGRDLDRRGGTVYELSSAFNEVVDHRIRAEAGLPKKRLAQLAQLIAALH